MTQSKRNHIAGKIVLVVVSGILTYIVLGHTGQVSPAHKFRLVPFVTHLETLTCLFTGCEEPSHILLALLIDGLGNIVVFMPLGAAWHMAFPRLRRPVVKAGLIGGAFSLICEIIQIWIPGRVVATDDVLLNTLGTVLGAWMLIVLMKWVRRQQTISQHQ